MRILIAGAGELGRLLASTLCTADHDVTIMDSDAGMLEHINDNLDIKVVEGSCVNIRTLKEAVDEKLAAEARREPKHTPSYDLEEYEKYDIFDSEK